MRHFENRARGIAAPSVVGILTSVLAVACSSGGGNPSPYAVAPGGQQPAQANPGNAGAVMTAAPASTAAASSGAAAAAPNSSAAGASGAAGAPAAAPQATAGAAGVQAGAGGTGVAVTPPAGTGSGAPVITPPAGGVDPVGDAMAGDAASGTVQPGATGTMPVEGSEMAMDECGLDTRFPGDEYCILPPPPDKGFQLRIGPSNYDNPDRKYILMPGEEITNDFTAISGNTTAKHFYYRQFRQRPGAHHNIITSSGGGASALGGGGLAGLGGLGHRIGTTNNLAEDNPAGGVIAPENKGVGIPIGANASINVSWHSINPTDGQLLREMWVNFWYVDESAVTDEAQSLFALGDVTFSIPPGTETTLGPYTCSVTGNGRMLWFYGHRHASNISFSAWRVRGLERELFYLGLNWEEPLVLEYSSTITNTPPDLAAGVEGGWSGILDLQVGDQIEWQCHVINQQPNTLRFSNNTYSGEMCIMDGEMIGTSCL